MKTQHENFNRYLELLGVPQAKPCIDALTRLVQAHMVRVPFENISKLYYWKTTGFNGLVDLNRYLDGIEQHNFGGTCYSNNYHLYQLLKYLGYDVVLCGADMSKPDVHIVNIVRVAGREYIVDVGYAAPFLMPLPRDLSVDYVVSLGSDRYVLQPRDEKGQSRLTLYKNGAPIHGYLVNPVPRTIDDFTHIINGSFRPEATFMNVVLLVRFSPGYSIIVHNMSFTESRGDMSTTKSLGTHDELVSVIQKAFDIAPDFVKVSLDGLSMQMSGWE